MVEYLVHGVIDVLYLHENDEAIESIYDPDGEFDSWDSDTPDRIAVIIDSFWLTPEQGEKP